MSEDEVRQKITFILYFRQFFDDVFYLQFEVVAKSCLETHETPKSTAKKFIANGSIANDSIANDSIVDNTYHQPEQQEQQAADFQAEFMRLHSKGDAELPEKNGLNSKVEECVGTPTEEIEFHSQLDLESNLKTYVINNAAADNANNNQVCFQCQMDFFE